MIDPDKVRRVLVLRLRSIGDTVLATPSLIALRRFLPSARIDILLEDNVAPVLDGFEPVDRVIGMGKGTWARVRTALELRRTRYDVVFNLHGGTTSAFLARAAGAPHRIGYSYYRYPSFYTGLLSSSADFWGRERTHSAEQQLALLGHAGVPVDDRPASSLAVTGKALASVTRLLESERVEDRGYALLHPATAFYTKQWPTVNFARTAEHLAEMGISTIAVSSKAESEVLARLKALADVPVAAFDDLSLPEITALASRARLFVGNDSGIAHIAVAVGTPSVVIFGSSNRDHWRPWTPADSPPNEIVFNEFACQPCPGYVCEVYGEPKCILSVSTESVFAAIARLNDQKHDR